MQARLSPLEVRLADYSHRSAQEIRKDVAYRISVLCSRRVAQAEVLQAWWLVADCARAVDRRALGLGKQLHRVAVDTRHVSLALTLAVTLGWIAAVVISIHRRQMKWTVITIALIALVTTGTICVNLPLRARFVLNHGAFTALIAEAGAPPRLPVNPGDAQIREMWTDFPTACPDSIGSFGIRDCSTFPAGYLFYDDIGVISQESGIAYMPEGVPAFDLSTDSFESPSFTHIYGPWYGFQSGW